MRILIFLPSLQAGGAERVTVTLANYWQKNGKNVAVVTLADDNDAYALDPGVVRYKLGLLRESSTLIQALHNNLQRIAQIRHIIQRERPDIAIGMMSSAAVLLIISAWGIKRVKIIVEEHIYPPLEPLRLVWRLMRYLTYPLADAVVVLTNDSMKWLRSSIPNARGYIIPNPIVLPMPSLPPQVEPCDWIPNDRKLLLAVGRLTYQKGFDILIRAFAAVAHRCPDWDLIILGEGPDRSSLQSLVEASQLTKRVKMPGRVGNLSEWYERADLFVLSSRYEGFGLVIVEAAAHGCPIVATSCLSGPSDIITHGYDGWLVQPNDDCALASALEMLMHNQDLRQYLAANALQIASRYTVSQISLHWERLFSKILRNP